MTRNRISLRKMPIDQGKIYPETHSLFPASLRQFLHDISFKRSSVYYIIISIPAVIHTKTVVMFRSKHYRFHSCPPGQGYNRISIPANGIKPICHRSIPISKNTGLRLDLFTISLSNRFSFPHSSQFGVNPPMNKHRKFLVQPL